MLILTYDELVGLPLARRKAYSAKLQKLPKLAMPKEMQACQCHIRSALDPRYNRLVREVKAACRQP